MGFEWIVINGGGNSPVHFVPWCPLDPVDHLFIVHVYLFMLERCIDYLGRIRIWI